MDLITFTSNPTDGGSNGAWGGILNTILGELKTGLNTLIGHFNDHEDDATLHFTEASIDHDNIANNGTNSHAQVDSHIADATLHFTEASIDHNNIANNGTNSHGDIDQHIDSATLHFTEASIDHDNIANKGTNSHEDIDEHIENYKVHNNWVSGANGSELNIEKSSGYGLSGGESSSFAVDVTLPEGAMFLFATFRVTDALSENWKAKFSGLTGEQLFENVSNVKNTKKNYFNVFSDHNGEYAEDKSILIQSQSGSDFGAGGKVDVTIWYFVPTEMNDAQVT